MIFDLPGCGDSPMPLQAASWAIWLEATKQAYDWAAQFGDVHVVGVRLGALLAAATRPDHLILAAPIEDGAQAIRGLFRASGMAADAASQQQALERFGYIDAAGYRISKELADGISAQRLSSLLSDQDIQPARLDLTGHAQPWLQIEPDEPAAIASATVSQLAALVSG